MQYSKVSEVPTYAVQHKKKKIVFSVQSPSSVALPLARFFFFPS